MKAINDNEIPVLEPDRQYFYINVLKEYVYELSLELGRTPTYSVTTFGCQMNAHDSEKLEGILESIGYVRSEEEIADFMIYNTCTVRENANLKLYGHLGHLKKTKQANKHMKLCLCGCMMQEKHVIETIGTKYKFVDLVFGTHNIYMLAELIYKQLIKGSQVIDVLDAAVETVEKLPQRRKYNFKCGVNIMFGCNNFCTYCIVPYVRGRERSRKPEDIIAEIETLAKTGVKEVMLLGQNVNSYDYIPFPELLRKVCKVDGIERVRFMTSHPKDLSDDLIDVMATEPKVCNQLHLPIQSGSTRILKNMNRRYSKEDYLALVDKIKAKVPDISITTDIMVGFPGETMEDIEDTMDVIRKVGYDQAFTFIYSKRVGTPAAEYPDQVSEENVKEYFNKVLDLVNEVSFETMKKREGQVKEVLVEEINSKDASLVTGKTTESFTVHFKGDASMIGAIVKVKLVSCKGFYYVGELVENE